MKTAKAKISYKGKLVDGLVFPKHVQRISEDDVPEGYVSNGKQQMNNGTFRITAIPSHLKNMPVTYTCKCCGKEHASKKEWVSTHKCHVCSDADTAIAHTIAREESARKNDADNFYYHLHKLIFNQGFNERVAELVGIFRQYFDVKEKMPENIGILRGVRFAVAHKTGFVFI